MAVTKSDASGAFDLFLSTYGAKHHKGCECLSTVRAELLAFYRFPAERWKRLQTIKPVESMFARFAQGIAGPRAAAAARDA